MRVRVRERVRDRIRERVREGVEEGGIATCYLESWHESCFSVASVV